MMKKRNITDQFSTLIHMITNDAGEKAEEILDEQGAIEKEYCKFYKELYKYREVEHTKEETLNEIGEEVRKISEMEREAFENPISLEEVNTCLKATRNNVSSDVSGFSRAFYKMF